MEKCVECEKETAEGSALCAEHLKEYRENRMKNDNCGICGKKGIAADSDFCEECLISAKCRNCGEPIRFLSSVDETDTEEFALLLCGACSTAFEVDDDVRFGRGKVIPTGKPGIWKLELSGETYRIDEYGERTLWDPNKE
jgi:hypothetical protein